MEPPVQELAWESVLQAQLAWEVVLPQEDNQTSEATLFEALVWEVVVE